MKSTLGILFIGALFFSTAWAMFCPTSFNSINLGDSIEQVQKVCGKPDSQKSSKKTPNAPQEWVYYIQSYPGMVGTLKTTIAFDTDGKVINISVNGAGESQTQICGPTIQFGDTQDSIKKACGDPAYINQSAPTNGAPKAVDVTEMHYNSTPPVTLVFEDGKLTARK